MLKSTSPQLQFVICRKSSDLPTFAKAELHLHEVDANVMLPTLNKCQKQEQKGIIVQDQLWIVAFVQMTDIDVKLILACTNGPNGKYPLFLFTPVPNAAMEEDPYIFLSLTSAARHLQTLVPTSRVFSVFGRELLSRTFSTIWSQQTNIPLIPEPYYHCKITYLTSETLELNRRQLDPISTAQIRPAGPSDLVGVARLCREFAESSPPFTLKEEGALEEAEGLIADECVWVLTLEGRPVTVVAFTRVSEKVATITKVYTEPFHRGGKLAERLVRAVCDYLLYERSKEKVALFVGTDNDAANVYQRVGFRGVGKGAPVDCCDTWCEMGFHRSYVDLGHW